MLSLRERPLIATTRMTRARAVRRRAQPSVGALSAATSPPSTRTVDVVVGRGNLETIRVYALGQGVPADNREAAKWLAKGAEKGHEGCIKGLRELAAGGVAEAAAALRRLRLAPL